MNFFFGMLKAFLLFFTILTSGYIFYLIALAMMIPAWASAWIGFTGAICVFIFGLVFSITGD